MEWPYLTWMRKLTVYNAVSLYDAVVMCLHRKKNMK